jgi:hypothetical protein
VDNAKAIYKVSRIAKASDVDSNFNPVAVGALRACEGDLRKGEVGLSCGASSTRRRQLRVHALAQKPGWSWTPEDLTGEGWSWGSDVEGSFAKGVNVREVGTLSPAQDRRHCRRPLAGVRHGGRRSCEPAGCYCDDLRGKGM